MLIWDEFSEHDTERQLTGSSQAITEVCANQGIHALGSTAYNATDESKERATHDHPFSTEDIRKKADQEESDSCAESPASGNPVDIGRRANIRIY